jgi:arylsulfatase A-like enzyme
MGAKGPPNIVFFFTDDQRHDTLRAVGNARIQTPVLDRLAGDGTVFTHAHIPGGTCGAVCMPSRAMLHTGRTLFHIEDRGNTVPDEHVLMGEHFRRHGYRTFGTGKWHNGKRAFARSFTDGAHIFFGGMGDHWNVPAYDFDPSGRYDGACPYVADFQTQEVRYRDCDHVVAGKHSTELFCDGAVDFLAGGAAAEPFFMYISFMAPHDPRTMPRRYLDLYHPDRIELPPNFLPEHPFDNGAVRIRDELLAGFPRTPDEVRRHIAAYYAMISHVDAEIGRVLAALEAAGRAGTTIGVFAGDNGLAVGQHGLMGKQSNYDHSVRVPLMLAGPGVPRGARRGTFAYLLDLFPTLCDLTGLPVPASVEGRSLVPALGDADARVRDTLFFAYERYQRAVRDERHKLIEYVVGGERTTQLFDLAADPWEMRDLAADPAQGPTVARLRELLQAYRREWDDKGAPWSDGFWEGYES